MCLKNWIGFVGLLSLLSSGFTSAFAGLPDSSAALWQQPAVSFSDSLMQQFYGQINFGNAEPLNPQVFDAALHGYLNLEAAGKLNPHRHILSVADLSLSSCHKRLWVIDLDRRELLFNTYMAHGQGSGEDMATVFSNREGSHATSLGFYVTGYTYDGQHGQSLCLEGMDPGFNDEAMNRNIVMHAAGYVSDTFIAQEGRLGRSWGCPALPPQQAEDIINAIKDSSCLFLYFPENNYLNGSVWLRQQIDKLPEFLFAGSQVSGHNPSETPDLKALPPEPVSGLLMRQAFH